MAVLIAVPILAILLIIQMAVLSELPLLRGVTDLVLVALIAWALQKRVRTVWHWTLIGGAMVGFASALPFGVHMAGYVAVVALTLLLKQRVWRAPLLAMFVATFFGTLVSHLIMIGALRVAGSAFSFWDALNLVALPSVLLNMLLAVPFYALFGDLARYLYPEELEV